MQIRIDTERAREIGQRFAAEGDRLAEIGRELQSAIGSLDTWAWDGHSRRQTEPMLNRVQPEGERIADGLDMLGRKLVRVADAFEQEDNAAARNLEGMPWVDFALAAGAAAAGVAVGGAMGDFYRSHLQGLCTDGVFRFGGQSMRIEDMTPEQLAATYHLSQMQGSNEPVTPEQIEALSSAFNLDEAYLREQLRGKNQGELYGFLDKCGLIWDKDRLGNPGGYFAEAHYSLNQQFVVLGNEGFEPGTAEFNDGKQFILSVKAGTIASCYPASKTKSPLPIGEIASLGTTSYGDFAPGHTALGAGNGVFVEAGGDGFNAGPTRAVDKYMTLHKEEGGILIQDIPGISDEQRAKVADYAVDHIGEPYNIFGTAFGIPDELQPIEVGPIGGQYCSELAYNGLKSAGIDIEPHTSLSLQHVVQRGIDAMRISPMELKNATVNGQPLVNEYVYFPEGYDFLGVPVPKSWLPGAKYGNGKVMT